MQTVSHTQKFYLFRVCAVFVSIFVAATAWCADQLPAVKTGAPYELQLPVALGQGVAWPFTFQVKAGTTLPPNFKFDANTAVLTSAAAGAAGKYSFTVQAVKNGIVIGASDYTLEITAGTPVYQPAASSTVSPVQPTIIPTSEGSNTVIVNATPSKNGVTTNLQLTVNGEPALLANPAASTDTDDKGHATLTLASPLEGGETLQVTQTLNGQPVPAATASGTSEVLENGNWGRAKAYFTAGMLTSGSDNNFSKQNVFASFLLDKMFRAATDTDLNTWGIHTYFETRLTAVPVSAQGSGTSGALAGSNSTPSTTSLDTFLATQKAAVVTVGFYFPHLITTWDFHGAENAFYIAPLFKAGVENPIGTLDPTTTSSTSNANGVATTTTTAVQPVPINGGRLYNFFAGGIRFAHVGHYSDDSINPDTISHLDLTIGKYSNLEVYRGIDTSNPANPVPIARARTPRLAAEGLLKVPNTPLYIGFSANIGFRPSPITPGGSIERPPDDLRFLFGTKFDVSKLLARLAH